MTCPNWDNYLQDGANLCPDCGTEASAMGDDFKPSGVAKPMLFALGFIALAALPVMCMGVIGRMPTTIGPLAATGTSAGSIKHISRVDKYFGCTNSETFNQISGYRYSGDMQAFGTALAEKMVTGSCTVFDGGEAVFLTDSAMLSGMVRVRRQGKQTQYWTNTEALR